jgi:hypothetical protein
VRGYIAHYTDVNIVPNQLYWYKVAAVNEAGEAYSNADSASIRTVGIADISNIKHIALYPNPASSYTELSVWNESPGSLIAGISIVDMEGRTFYEKQTQLLQGKNDFMIDISAIGSGVYIVYIRTDNEAYGKRLVIVR